MMKHDWRRSLTEMLELESHEGLSADPPRRQPRWWVYGYIAVLVLLCVILVQLFR